MLNNYFKKFDQAAVAVLLLLSVFHIGSVHANEPMERDTVFFKTVPTVEQLERQLFPNKTRSLVFNKKPAGASADAQSAVAKKPAESAVGLPVLFHFG